MVKTIDVTKSFNGQKSVLENISLQVNQGEIFVVIGPSGVGKTTLLRLIDLLDVPSSGQIFFKGTDTTPLNKLERLNIRRKLGMVFQSTQLFDDTVYANVAYGLKIREVRKDQIKEKVTKALQVVGLEDLKDRHAKTLSGGENQRIAIARILAYEPELLLLDELTANLDPSNTAKIEKIITDVRKNFDTTILVSTHNMFQAKRLADQVAFLYEGLFIETGDPQTVFEHPKNPLTKAFINGELIY